MATVGEQLREAREAKKLSINDVADSTKIRTDHIRALEEGNYSVFSAPVYIRGFVRTYANLLKLDSVKILEQLGVELAGPAPAPGEEPAPPQPTGLMDDAIFEVSKFVRRLLLPISIVAVAVIVAGALYYGWFRAKKKDPLEGLGAGLYKAAPAAETLPLPHPSN